MNDNRFTDDLPDEVRLRVGQVVRLPLVGAGGAGNRWRIEPPGPGYAVPDRLPCAWTRVEITPAAQPAEPGGGPPPTTSQAGEFLVLEGVSPGELTVLLHLGRVWTPDQPLATHTVLVRVTAAERES